MRPECIGEAMFALIRLRIRQRGAPQQAEADDVLLDAVAILAVVEQADTIATLAQIHPFLRAGLEARPIPTGITVSRPLHVAPLNFKSGVGGQDVDREGDFQQNMPLAPIDTRVDVQAWLIVSKSNALHIIAVQNSTINLELPTQR